jgi:DNA polymerase-1
MMPGGIEALIREAVSEGARFDCPEGRRPVVRWFDTLPDALREQLLANRDEVAAHLLDEEVGPSGQLLRRLGITVRYVQAPNEARKVLDEILAEANGLDADVRVGFDIETAPRPEYRQLVAPIKLTRGGRRKNCRQDAAGLDPNRAGVRLCQFYPGGDTVYVLDLANLPFDILKPLLELPLVAHNALFETSFLIAAGIEPVAVPCIDCTMLAANALFGTLPSLADLANDHLQLAVDKSQQTSDWATQDLDEEQIAYAASDAVIAELLSRKLLPRLATRERVYRVMVDAQPAVAWMRTRGMLLDGEEHAKMDETWRSDRDTAAKDVAKLLPGINPKSAPQVANWLKNILSASARAAWPRTPSGQLSTAASALVLAGDDPAVGALLRLRRLDYYLSSYGASLAEHVNSATGRVHADYRIGGAKTGRFSCSKPNIQSQPKGKDGGPSLRPLWAAPEGRILVGGDWNQMELRAGGIIADDLKMKTAFKNGQDLHRLTAASVSGQSLNAIAKDGAERQLAKALNFGLLYGMGPPRFREYAAENYGVTMSLTVAGRSHEAFFRTYHGLQRWQRRQASLSKRIGYAETRMGRRVEWCREGEFRYTLALNTPIQGSCAEALLVALATLPAALKGLDAFPVALIHDEILLEAAEADAVPVSEALEQAMTDAFCEVFPESPREALVEVKCGRTWADVK